MAICFIIYTIAKKIKGRRYKPPPFVHCLRSGINRHLRVVHGFGERGDIIDLVFAIVGHFDGNEPGDAGFFHGYAVQGFARFHRPSVVGDNDELRLFGEFFDDFDKARDIGIIEGASTSSRTQKGLGLTR